jgi:hypothetical protein
MARAYVRNWNVEDKGFSKPHSCTPYTMYVRVQCHHVVEPVKCYIMCMGTRRRLGWRMRPDVAKEDLQLRPQCRFIRSGSCTAVVSGKQGRIEEWLTAAIVSMGQGVKANTPHGATWSKGRWIAQACGGCQYVTWPVRMDLNARGHMELLRRRMVRTDFVPYVCDGSMW